MQHGFGRGRAGFLMEEEKAERPAITRAFLARILSYLKPFWKQLVLALLAILLTTVLRLLPAILNGCIVQRDTHQELLAQGGLYARLYETRFEAEGKEILAGLVLTNDCTV